MRISEEYITYAKISNNEKLLAVAYYISINIYDFI